MALRSTGTRLAVRNEVKLGVASQQEESSILTQPLMLDWSRVMVGQLLVRKDELKERPQSMHNAGYSHMSNSYECPGFSHREMIGGRLSKIRRFIDNNY